MIKINDGMLLKEVIGFCDSLIEENVLKKYQVDDATELELAYPLDKGIRDKLNILKQRGIDKNTEELSYWTIVNKVDTKI